MKIYFKLMLGLYAVALLICGVLRIVLKLNYMDVSTGFYAGGDTAVTIFNFLLGITPVIMFASNRVKKADGDYPVYTRSRLCNFLAIVTGLAILAFTVMTIIGPAPVRLEQGRSELFYTISKYLNLTLGILAGLSFVYLGAGGVFGRNKAPLGLFVVVPTLWQVVFLVTSYNGYTTVTAISDHLLVVLFMLFNSLFLLGHARTVCIHMRKDGRNYAIPSGLCASLCGFLLTIPNFIYMLVNRAPMPTRLIGFTESIYILIMSVYALLFVIGMMKSIRKV